MPVEANASIRVNVPALKAEIEIECLPYNTFWHLKLCLVDGILSRGRNYLSDDVRSEQSRSLQSAAATTTNDRQKRPIMQLVADSLTGRKLDKTGTKSCMLSTTSNASLTSSSLASGRGLRLSNIASTLQRCHSSASSLSSADTWSGSPLGMSAWPTAKQRDSTTNYSRSQSQVGVASSPAFHYGFSGPGRPDWNDLELNELSEDEEAAVRALVLATGDLNGYACSDTVSTIGNHLECSSADACHQDDQENNRRISDLLELDGWRNSGAEHHYHHDGDEYNIYESLRFGKLAKEDHSYESKFGDSSESGKNTDDENTCDRFAELELEKMTNTTLDRRLSEQISQSGYMNYGFYSFSLARFIDDQTSLTEYLTLISSSTGASYYLDLEFKLKQRQQLGSLISNSAYARGQNGNAQYALRLTTVACGASSQVDAVNRLSRNTSTSNSSHSDVISLKLNRLPSLSSLHCRIKRTNSISTIASTNESRANKGSNINISNRQSFTNNMIAKLASSGASGSHKSTAAGQTTKNSSSSAPAVKAAFSSSSSSSQCKRRRSKLLDVLLNTNWSKYNQQASNLMKLNKVLLVCDANFLDERTGESPLSLAITSNQINAAPSMAAANNRAQSSGNQAPTSSSIGPSSASLFNLQFQHPTTSHNQQTLQQTSAFDISQSRAPLVEKILLLLIKSGALIDFRNNDGITPLHVAAMKSNFWALKTLLDLGASTDYRDINGLTPLYYSILHRAELKVTQLLLNHMSNKSQSNGQVSGAGGQNWVGNKIMGISDQQGWQEVHHACKLGLDAHLDKLLYHGCDINAKISGSGNTPLHVAAINDQLQAAKVLLLRGADRTITNNSHQTAHQVAVISNNMDLAEFIAGHDETGVVPFTERPNNRHSVISTALYNPSVTVKPTNRFSMPLNQQLVSSYSSNQIAPQQPKQLSIQTPTGIVQPQRIHDLQSKHLNPLTLDVDNHCTNGDGTAGNSAPSTSTSGTGHHTAQSSLLSINSSSQNHHLDVQANNISPCLSQRSCGTSNTTSSGVCCDGEGNSSDAVVGSRNHQSNITVISIGSNSIDRATAQANREGAHLGEVIDPPPPLDFVNDADVCSKINLVSSDGNQNHESSNEIDNRDEEDLSSSESSSNGLYSLMSNSRPLFAGSIVEATTDYQSGDPNHLQLHREDMIEVLEYPADLLQGGQLPRMANKPMLFGRRQTDGKSGLFPSFCARRTKQRQPSLRQRIPMTDLTNSSGHYSQQQQARHPDGTSKHANERQSNQVIRGTNLPQSQSMAAIGQHQRQNENMTADSLEANKYSPRPSFKKYQVTLTKINQGFGFVLRGAKINPATLSAQPDGLTGKIAIDERLMTANNLASLQYLDDIELGSVAQQAGLKRGDFLIAVNGQDVRLCSHENVVQMIRNSGDRVHLTIASPIVSQSNYADGMYSSKTLTRVKPEPPKRDPTTTLTKNKPQGIRSLSVAPQVQQCHHPEQASHRRSPFDADKPLPSAPAGQISSPNESLNLSANLSHLNSTNSLSSAGPEQSQSITSISTVGSADQQQTPHTLLSQASQHPNQDQSSSSTTTLTTVASKPQAPTKPSAIYLKSSVNQSFSNQSTYQSAAVITSNRSHTQEGKTVDSQSSKPKSSQSVGIMHPNQLPAPAPPVPPPPPPLPDFTNSTRDGSWSIDRRTSDPSNQAPSSSTTDRLLRKRESLAVLNLDKQHNEPAPICAVAAACAAAANSRLQRQQQKQQIDSDHRPAIEKIEKVDVTPETSHKSVTEVIKSSSVVIGGNSILSKETECEKDQQSIDDQHNLNTLTSIPDSSTKPKRDQSARSIQSATLGRKSSAQIIQQPKQNHSTQSQTLRVINTPKRMSILNYKMTIAPHQPSLPPPPLPLHAVARKQQNYQDVQHSHQHHNHVHNKVSEEPCVHQITERAVNVSRSQNDFGQRQLQNQHQLILRQQQQLRQQQIMQEHLRVQQQTKQRVCQHIHNTVAGCDYDPIDHQIMPETADPQSYHQNHHHHHHHEHKQYHQQIPLEAQRYHLSQSNYYTHDFETTPAIMHQQQSTNQNHLHHNHHHQMPPAYHLSQKVNNATPHHHHHHNHHRNSHIHHDQQQFSQQQQQQHQKLLQQQQYLHNVNTAYYGTTTEDC